MHEAKGWGLLGVPTPTPLALGARRRRVGDDSRSISMERRFPRRHRQPPHLKTAHSSTVGRRRYCAPLPALPTLLSADRIYVSPGAMDWGEIGFFLRGFSSTSRANTLLLLVFLLCLPRQLTPVTPHRPRPNTFLDRYPHHADAARSHAILCIPYHPACKKKNLSFTMLLSDTKTGALPLDAGAFSSSADSSQRALVPNPGPKRSLTRV